jgi:acyl dehydratase
MILTDKQRAVIGRESAPRIASMPPNMASARQWCEMIEDANPIYTNEAYARTTWLQGLMAPPSMLMTWDMYQSWPEVERKGAVYELELEDCPSIIAVTAVQEFLMPVRYGDTLSVTTQVSSVSEEKTTRLGTGHFVSILDIFRNQFQQVVGTHRFDLFVYGPVKESAR